MSIDASQLKTSGVYASQTPLGTLLSDLAEIEQICRKWRGYRKTVGWTGALLLIAGLAFLIVLNDFPALVVAGIACLVAAVVCIIAAFRFARNPLRHTDRCATARAIAETLRDDTHPKSPVTVRMSLGDQARTLLKQQEWSARRKGQQKFFADEWLTIENAFLDGSVMTESVTDLVRQRSYVNARGKSKSKTRTHHVVAMRFKYPEDLYGDPGRLPEGARQLVKTPSTAAVRGVEIRPGQLKLKATVSSSKDLIATSKMLQLGVYRILNLSRKIAAHSRAAEGGSR